MKKIMLINPKGGSGKSNLSTNLAGYYANAGHNVVMVDMDTQQSSLHWLKSRPEECKSITPMTMRQVALSNEDIDYVIIDTPARLGFKQVDALLRQADLILIPILPSPTDIQASRRFIYELLVKHNVTFEKIPIGIVANRSRLTTNVYRELVSFLNDIKYPFITTIRDSSNYLKCAREGKSIFDYKIKAMDQDREDWAPLIEWLKKHA